MPITLKEYSSPAIMIKSGQCNDVPLVTGDWLQIRHGNLSVPTTELQVQCPDGKAWNVRIIVEISETDA